MTLVLAVETATAQSSVALADSDSDRLLFEITLSHGRDLSRLLFPAIQAGFNLAGRKLNQVQLVAVSIGPGSFTGLRIGVTAAKTLSYAIEVPVVPVSTLQAMAYDAEAANGRRIVTALDARRGEAFAASFTWRDGSLVRATDDALMPVELITSLLGDEYWKSSSSPLPGSLIVEGVLAPSLKLDTCVNGSVSVIKAYPAARNVARAGLEGFARGESMSAVEVIPRYLRRSYADEKAVESLGLASPAGNKHSLE